MRNLFSGYLKVYRTLKTKNKIFVVKKSFKCAFFILREKNSLKVGCQYFYSFSFQKIEFNIYTSSENLDSYDSALNLVISLYSQGTSCVKSYSKRFTLKVK